MQSGRAKKRSTTEELALDIGFFWEDPEKAMEEFASDIGFYEEHPKDSDSKDAFTGPALWCSKKLPKNELSWDVLSSAVYSAAWQTAGVSEETFRVSC